MSTRDLTGGQIAVLASAAVAMVAVGGIGAAGTYTNAAAAFHREATAAGVVAAGEGLTLVLALIMLARTMLNMSSPLVVRGGMWLAPLAASGIGIAIATGPREAAVYAVTPLAMSGAAEGLGFVARSVVVYRTGSDADADRRNAATVQQLAYQQALATGHPDEDTREDAARRAWKLAGKVGAGDRLLAGALVETSRDRLTAGASLALGRMLALPGADARPDAPAPRPQSATDVLRTRFATMDPAAAIRFAADARPDAAPAELATILGTYGVAVDPVAVALVLGQQPDEYRVDRPDAPAHQQVSALDPVSLEGAVLEAASVLGPDARAREIVEHVARHRRLVVTEPYVRTALSRAAKKPTAAPDADPMRGGYA
ncbi:hypothetical protein ABTX35_01915 [Streptomyces sp. NPDC096080]|uniref:hypothetical protein n=1 Tax=Streptomyces sp. NPDC096080 TaxID=3156693 RepID=UPI0033204069